MRVVVKAVQDFFDVLVDESVMCDVLPPLLQLLLVATGIGIIVVPFAFCAAFVAFLFGKVAVYRFVGQQINSLNCNAGCCGASRRAAAVDRKWVRLCKRLKLR